MNGSWLKVTKPWMGVAEGGEAKTRRINEGDDDGELNKPRPAPRQGWLLDPAVGFAALKKHLFAVCATRIPVCAPPDSPTYRLFGWEEAI